MILKQNDEKSFKSSKEIERFVSSNRKTNFSKFEIAKNHTVSILKLLIFIAWQLFLILFGISILITIYYGNELGYTAYDWIIAFFLFPFALIAIIVPIALLFDNPLINLIFIKEDYDYIRFSYIRKRLDIVTLDQFLIEKNNIIYITSMDPNWDLQTVYGGMNSPKMARSLANSVVIAYLALWILIIELTVVGFFVLFPLWVGISGFVTDTFSFNEEGVFVILTLLVFQLIFLYIFLKSYNFFDKKIVFKITKKTFLELMIKPFDILDKIWKKMFRYVIFRRTVIKAVKNDIVNINEKLVRAIDSEERNVLYVEKMLKFQTLDQLKLSTPWGDPRFKFVGYVSLIPPSLGVILWIINISS